MGVFFPFALSIMELLCCCSPSIFCFALFCRTTNVFQYLIHFFLDWIEQKTKKIYCRIINGTGGRASETPFFVLFACYTYTLDIVLISNEVASILPAIRTHSHSPRRCVAWKVKSQSGSIKSFSLQFEKFFEQDQNWELCTKWQWRAKNELLETKIGGKTFSVFFTLVLSGCLHEQFVQKKKKIRRRRRPSQEQ